MEPSEGVAAGGDLPFVVGFDQDGAVDVLQGAAELMDAGRRPGP